VSRKAQQKAAERALLRAGGKEAREYLLKELLADKEAAAEAKPSMPQVRHIDGPLGRVAGSCLQTILD
jgi:hypothetical protein